MGVLRRLRSRSVETRLRPVKPTKPTKSTKQTVSAPLRRFGLKKGVKEQKKQAVGFNELKGVETIGQGSFGTVLLVKHEKSRQAFALKIQSKEFLLKRKLQDLVKNEVAIMSAVSHPLLNTLHQTFEDEQNVYMLLEYVPGGDMFSLIRNRGAMFENEDHVFYAACILSSLEALHKHDIVYRDLKPENILIDAQGYTRMVDFGFAKRLKGRTYTPCGTPEYFSPELISGKGYGKGNDVWGFGILLYELMSGHNPFAFPAGNSREIMKAILREPLTFHARQTDRKARFFLSTVLNKRVEFRGGCLKGGIGALKGHVWFSELDWAGLDAKRVPAPWIPDLKNDFDSEHFDKFESSEDLPNHLHTA